MLEFPARKERKAMMVHLDPKAYKAPQATMARKGHPARRDRRVIPVDHRDRKVRRATMDQLVRRVRKVILVAHRVRPDPKETMDRKAQSALKEQMARWDPKARRVRKAIPAALKVRPAHKETTARKARPVR